MSTTRAVFAGLLFAALGCGLSPAPAARAAQRPGPAARPVQEVSGPAAPAPRPEPLTGACYLKFGERLECVSPTTEPECRERCDYQLCDSYNWLDRLACWTWGYGG